MVLAISLPEAVLFAGIILAVSVVIACWIMANGRGSKQVQLPHPSPNFSQIEYPQSEEGFPVQPTNVPVEPDTPLQVGSTVLAFSQGRWWRAEVVGLGPDDNVRVHFPGWDAKWDTVIPREELQVDLHGPKS